MNAAKVSATGQCLCGTVVIAVDDINPKIGACHCDSCRQWGGGPFITAESDGAFKLSGEDSIKIFDSSDWAERGFCQNCGSHLYYRLKGQSKYWFAAGLFDAIPGAVFDHQVFIDSKPSYYSFAETTQCMTGAEVFAQFGK